MEKLKLSPVEKIYYSFYITKKNKMYFNEIRTKMKMSISSLQNAFKKLEKTNEIIKIKEKGNTFYELKNKELIALNFTKFDLELIENLNRNIKLPVKEFIKKIDKISFILLFGSASRGEEKKGSDIDLLIVIYDFENEKLNELYKKIIKENIEQIKKSVNAKSLHPLSLVFVDEKDFKIRKDYLLDEAKKTGFCIYNHLNYYRFILKDEN
jgi:predicted nucleotidyltransferase